MLVIGANSASIINSRHDLQATVNKGSGDMLPFINNYGEVCVYCHTPHAANANVSAPLWNRNALAGPYNVYSSSTINTSIPGTPSSISLACLGCHDGTIATDSIMNAPGSGANLGGPWYGNSAAPLHYKMKAGAGACGTCHTGAVGHDALKSYLGTNLSDDHPISMSYPTPAQDPDFNAPPDNQKGWSDVRLYASKVECPSCHDVHDPALAPFLRKSNAGSVLCTTCHTK